MEQSEPIKMSFGRAIQKGLTGTVKFRGRASRAEFWYYTLFCFIALLFLSVATLVLDNTVPFQYSHIFMRSWLVFAILFVLSHSAASVRRIQDTERNGWMWFGTYLTPWLILIVAFIWKIEYGVSLNHMKPEPGVPDPFVMNWWTAIFIIDLIVLLAVLIATIIQYCRKGTEGPNIYGPDPLFRNNPKPIK